VSVKAGIRSAIGGVLSGVLAVALAAAPALASPSPTGLPPDVVRMTVLDAEQILRAWAPQALIVREVIGTPPKDADLGYGWVRKQGFEPPLTVTLYVEGQVPDLVGETRGGAEKLLTLYGMGSNWQPEAASAI
jgi:hypothetical protein